MDDWETFKQELLKNPEVAHEYKKLEPEYRLAAALLKARIAKKMTQAQVAEKAGVKQVIIARLESGTANPTVGTVSKVASVLGKELELVVR
jgi:predicted transcriptional regulator